MTTCRRVRALVVALVAVCGGLSLSAHPGSTTAVVITVHGEGAARVELHTDARALVAKLEAAAGAPLTNDERTPDELAGRVTALAPVLLQEVELRVDDERRALVMLDVDVDAAGQAVVKMGGTVPSGADTLTWSARLVYGAYPLSLRRESGQNLVQWLQGRETTPPLPLAATGRITAKSHGVWLGFTHIVPHGLDHILFVVGLVLLGTRLGPLFIQISAFTLAHSVTLGLALFGVVSLAPDIVEPLIALSVVYIGLENLFASRLTRWRVAVVFGFGLLHGLGFAGVLVGLGVPAANVIGTLVSFNIGVELGQLVVVAAAWFVMYRVVPIWRETVARVVSAGVALTGLIWTLERVWA